MSDAKFGKYRLIAELGHGGMADVFLAVMAGPEGSGFSKLTVIKRLRQNLADEPEFVEMLVDEARISARLNHPNVVQTNEVGAVGNQYFLAMEYLDGQPLHRIQHRAGQVAQRKAQEADASTSGPQSMVGVATVLPKECQYLVLVDTLAGLHHAHELTDYDGTSLEIVHRDVTPHNVFVTYQGQVKVVDFGIAKAVGRASETRQGVVKGKVRYMAPEQAMGHTVDRRADVFSVGVMLWEVAAGRRLWKDVDDLGIVQALIGGRIPASPKQFNADVPDEIDRICQKALASHPDERYATAEDFRADLEQYLAESGTLVHARRRLGACINELFADKRNEIKVIIEKQLAALTRETGSISMPLVETTTGVTSEVIPPGPGSEPTGWGPGHATAATGLTDAVTSVYNGSSSQQRQSYELPAAPPPKRSLMLPVVGAGVVALAAAGLFVGRALHLSKAAGAQHTQVEPAVSSSVTSSTTETSEINVSFSAVPSTASITVDGNAVPSPFRGRYPTDAKEHTLRVEASGYEPHVETMRFDRDLSISVTLVRARVTPPPQAAAPGWRPPVRPTNPAGPTTAAPPPATTTVAPAPSGKTHTPKPDIDNTDPWGNKK
jgi:eukaryotic-like serine/threonine-protein kinase